MVLNLKPLDLNMDIFLLMNHITEAMPPAVKDFIRLLDIYVNCSLMFQDCRSGQEFFIDDKKEK